MADSAPCSACGSTDYDPRFAYPARSGALRCGDCWTEWDLLAAFGREVRRILQGAPRILRWCKTDGETLALINRRGARMGVLRRSEEAARG